MKERTVWRRPSWAGSLLALSYLVASTSEFGADGGAQVPKQVGCPIVTAAGILGGGTICPGGTATIVVTVVGGSPPYNVTLSNAGMMSGGGGITFFVHPVASTIYSVMGGMDSHQCPMIGGIGTSVQVIVGSAPAVTVDPMDQLSIGGPVTFTAEAKSVSGVTVQWQVSSDGGSTYADIPGADAPELAFVPLASQSGSEYRAQFTSFCGTAATEAASLTVYDACLKDDSAGDLFQFNSATGQYRLIRCSDGFTLSGRGVVKFASGVTTIEDSNSARQVTAQANFGRRTGTATIRFMYAEGTWQVMRITGTHAPSACACK
ncbi:MAG TPA: hypothetical protein VI756_27675 [Blastocatellia bacterium]